MRIKTGFGAPVESQASVGGKNGFSVMVGAGLEVSGLKRMGLNFLWYLGTCILCALGEFLTCRVGVIIVYSPCGFYKL